MREYGILYLNVVFPKGHKLEWLNYLHLSRSLPKDISDGIDDIASEINNYDNIIIPLDRSIDPGCVTDPSIIEEIANNVYLKFCDLFKSLTGDIDCVRLVWSIGEINDVDVKSTHHLYHDPVVIKVGRFLDSSKKSGIFKV